MKLFLQQQNFGSLINAKLFFALFAFWALPFRVSATTPKTSPFQFECFYTGPPLPWRRKNIFLRKIDRGRFGQLEASVSHQKSPFSEIEKDIERGQRIENSNVLNKNFVKESVGRQVRLQFLFL